MNEGLRAARRKAKVQAKRDQAADKDRQRIGWELLDTLMKLGAYAWLEEQTGLSSTYLWMMHRGQRPVTAEVIVRLLKVEVEGC